MALNARKIFSLLNRVVREVSRYQSASRSRQAPSPLPHPASGQNPAPRPAGSAVHGGVYPGDYTAAVAVNYNPSLDGEPDPGEIVWGWVPYEEDHSQGKDRPVLLVGRDGKWLLGLMLTSKDNTNGTHRNDDYLDIGSGSWDAQGRPSEVKLDRVIRMDPATVRREGAVLDKRRFDLVVSHLNRRR
ncbi:type II toxin-antitoxin system PemK/MazF family toxin [Glutamicibacter creatinolyticus]|uniref:type II toxin-antitoxin system PemK/MazF family toxin n=1 Tax=Glutamicibacter creatinolyticus TaxID=162496 RepID=UPI0031DE0A69